MNINELCTKAYAAAKAKGWYDIPNVTFGDRIALCHSELSEALEEYRNPMSDDMGTYYRRADGVYVDASTHEYVAMGERCLGLNKPEGVPSELADVVIRIADMCGFYGIDLHKAIEEKLAYNATRPYRHGHKVL